MRIAYCEDEKVQSIFLRELIELWEKTANEYCEVTVYGSAEEMLFENQDSFSFDFIILDIELDRMNGIELARRIRKMDNNVPIAFLSNRREYVFEGYEVNAVRYLLKPIKKEPLFPILDMILKSMGEEKQYIILELQGEKRKVALEDICYVEALGHYIAVHTDGQSLEVKMSINEMASRLNGHFVATHRSYLVNLQYIERITRTDCILNSGLKIPISRSSYKDVNQKFIEFYKGGPR